MQVKHKKFLEKVKKDHGFNGDEIEYIFAKNLYLIREQKKLTKISLARKSESLGWKIKSEDLVRYEKARRAPSLDRIVKLCVLYGCSADELLGLVASGVIYGLV